MKTLTAVLSLVILATACGASPTVATPTPRPLEVLEQQTGYYALNMQRMGLPQYINVNPVDPREGLPDGSVILILGKLGCPDDGHICVSNLEITMTKDQADSILKALQNTIAQ